MSSLTPASPNPAPLRVSVAIFLGWGGILAVAGGAGAGLTASVMHRRFVFMSGRTDAGFLGASIAQLYAADPALEKTVAIYMTMMSAVLGAMGIAMMSLAWFGLRRRSKGALAGLVLMPVPIVAWFLVVLGRYRAHGVSVQFGDVPPFVWVGAIVAIVGAVFGWQGLHLPQLPNDR